MSPTLRPAFAAGELVGDHDEADAAVLSERKLRGFGDGEIFPLHADQAADDTPLVGEVERDGGDEIWKGME
jgi:hypothetical protein